MPNYDFVTDLASTMKSAGLNPELVAEEYSEKAFGNAMAEFRMGKLLLRFVRDRSVDELMIASMAQPGKFYPFIDIEIGMGWKSIQEAVNRQRPSLTDVIYCVAAHFGELEATVLADPKRFTQASIERLRKQGFLPSP